MDRETSISLLLVEDNSGDYALLKRLLTGLRSIKAKVEWVSSFAEARQIIAERIHDLYLLDHDLGEGTGLELLKEIMGRRVEAPVILLTDEVNHEIDLEAMRAGASDYLVKGELTAAQLDRSVRYALRQKQTEKQVLYMAMYDSLTGLPNRDLFRDRLSQAMARVRRYGGTCAVLFVDLNDFKRINDTLGHSAGDLVLAEVARRLASGVRVSDSVGRSAETMMTGRFGGDEFTILLTDVEDAQAAVLVAQRILEALAAPLSVDGKELVIGASIGIALSSEDCQEPEGLLRNSDAAMYVAKRKRRNGYQLYEDSMTRQALARLTLEAELRTAVVRREFILHYQPVVDLDTGEIVGLEALVRWQRASGDLLGPNAFIALAEETDLILPIGLQVLEAACRQLQAWRRAGLDGFWVSVNLSVRQCTPGLVHDVRDILRRYDLPPDTLTLEVTESIFMSDVEEIRRTFNELKLLGVRLSIDDFGSGYFSFALLKNLPIDGLKIDRSLVQDPAGGLVHVTVLRAIHGMATALGLHTVGEGIETLVQLRNLSASGCRMGQGYLFSRPISAEAMTRLFTSEANDKSFAQLIAQTTGA